MKHGLTGSQIMMLYDQILSRLDRLAIESRRRVRWHLNRDIKRRGYLLTDRLNVIRADMASLIFDVEDIANS